MISKVLVLPMMLLATTLATMVASFSPASLPSPRQRSRCFSASPTTESSSSSSPSSEDAAAVLTEFMAKAHEEKIRAMGRVEAKYKDRIEELEAKVAELEGPSVAGSHATSANSFAFPATNKLTAEKVRAYQKFLSDYVVKASAEKQRAVKDTEAKLKAKYEAIIEELKKE
jgi:hypothetical protein